MMRSVLHVLLLVALATTVLFSNLGGSPLWDRDEPRNAGCAAEMMQRGDWVVPVFNNELRTHKPVLLYWLMMSAYSVFGINEFGARCCSAVLGMGTVLLTFGMGKRLFDSTTGVWSGAILATTIMFGVASRAATPDALLIFCGTLATAVFVFFAFPRDRADSPDVGQFPRSPVAAIGIYAAMGFGILAKGPVGLVLPAAVIGMYLLIVRLHSMKRCPTGWIGLFVTIVRPFAPQHFLRTCWAMRPFTALVTAAAVAMPWYIWVTLRTDGVWTREFFWTHNVSRATGTMEGHAGPPILFYVVAILVGFFPWSILTIPTGLHTFSIMRQGKLAERRAVVLLLCWVAAYIVLFSIARTKLPSYVTPCYPALALLAGVFVRQLSLGGVRYIGWVKFGLVNLIGVGVAVLVALPIAARRFLPGSEWIGVVGVAPLFGGLAGWWWIARDDCRRATHSLGIAAIGFCVFLFAIAPTEVARHRRYGVLFSQIAANAGPIVAFGHLEPSWIFYGGKSIRGYRPQELDEFVLFANTNPNALIITTPQQLDELRQDERLAKELRVIHSTEYFLRDYELVLVRSDDGEFIAVADEMASPRPDPSLKR